MQFFYHKDSGEETIVLDTQDSHYLFCVRRFKQGDILHTANLKDMRLYRYKHTKKSTFTLIDSSPTQTQLQAHIRILLAIIDIKDIYALLPSLNALNVFSLDLFYADFSQKNRTIDMQKAQKILQYSSMQCGRMGMMQLALHANLESLLESFPNATAIDFIDSMQQECIFENLPNHTRKEYAQNGILVGPEGGFSTHERNMLYDRVRVYRLQTPHILTAHLASIYISGLCV